MERDYWGFNEWSETRINPMLGNAVLEVFPKSQAPIIRSRWIDGKRTDQLEWQTMRWGLPGPPQFGGAPVTNIRNVKSPHWRSVLGVAHRCVCHSRRLANTKTLHRNAKTLGVDAPLLSPCCKRLLQQ
jgi:putative SOS response-associated peptidase YedK